MINKFDHALSAHALVTGDGPNLPCPEVRHLKADSGPAAQKGKWIALLACAVLWLIVWNELRLEWSTNPQYSFGWLVPGLALGLLFRRWAGSQQRATKVEEIERQGPGEMGNRHSWLALASLALTALPILPIRLVLEANPGWRTLQLFLVCCAVAVTLLGVYIAGGRPLVRQAAFPICFMLVSVPWPLSIEMPVREALTRFNSSMVVELMGILGVPAVQHGNLIEVGSGIVGINEACSGIRSFQSSLMIALFFGEFYRLGLVPRMAFVPLGFLLAIIFNLCRTSMLTLIAAKRGMAAINDYHDGAGVAIMLACALSMWAIAAVLGLRNRSPRQDTANAQAQKGTGLGLSAKRPPSVGVAGLSLPLRQLGCALLVWLIVGEATVEAWYRSHEDRSSELSGWRLLWPPQEPGFKEESIPVSVRELLQYDEGYSGSWPGDAGGKWLIYYLRWKAGRVAASATRSHSPEVCLRATGKRLASVGDNRSPIKIDSIVFPFRRYEFEEAGRIVHVFHCLWEEHAPSQFFAHDGKRSMLALRWRAAVEGRRNLGQRSIEIFTSDAQDAQAAQAAVEARLRKWIVRE